MLACWRNILSARGRFLSAVLVLVSGTAFAHVITGLALPVLSRLYTPQNFSLLAVFSSLVAIVSVSACLRFDVAIAIPDDDIVAFDLLVLSLASAIIVSVFAAAVVFITPRGVAEILGQPGLVGYLWLVPIGILLSGVYSALQNWFVRERQFPLIARSRVFQSAACAGTQIGTAGLPGAPLGLLIGYLLNTGAACVGLGFRFLKQEYRRRHSRGLSWERLKAAWDSYSRFPKYSTWEALCNSAAIQVPLMMIAALASSPEAGYLLLAMSIIQAPMALFGAAISQVYLSQAPREHRSGNLASFTVKVTGGLMRGGVGPLLAIGILSPQMFGLVFGREWERAGVLVAWMMPWFIFQFLAVPISMGLHITGHQRVAFGLQLFGLAARIISVVIPTYLPGAPLAEGYAVSGLTFYFVYLWLILRCVGAGLDQVFREITKARMPLIIWTISAALGVVILPSRLPGVYW